MKNPTFDSVTKKISEWVGMENMDRQFRGDNKTAAKVNVVKGAGQKSLPKPPSSIAITPTTLKGRAVKQVTADGEESQ